MIDINEEINKLEDLQRYKDTQTIVGILDCVTTVVCDHLCRYPKELGDIEQLEEICKHCPMDKF